MTNSVFIHLPKTAGTSFNRALSAGFGSDRVTSPFAASVITAEQAAEMATYTVVAGHVSLHDVERHFPDAKRFTILRNPIDRCLSWYYFARSMQVSDHADVRAAQQLDVEAFFTLAPSVTFRNIFNRQVRQLGDHALNPDVEMPAALERAKGTLNACAWIGRQECLDVDLERLPDAFPEMAGVEFPRLNITANRRRSDEIDPQLTEKIARYNQYDFELYAYACALLDARSTASR